MSNTTEQYRCRHIRATGHRCGSPAMRHENFCYYHNTNRPPIRRPRQPALLLPAGTPSEPEVHAPFTLLLLEDRTAVQAALGQVVQRLAARQIDPKEAALLLYALQIASSNLPSHPKPQPRSQSEPEPEQVEEVVADPVLGPVAPVGEPLDPLRHVSSLGRELLQREQERRERAEAALAAAYLAHPDLLPPPTPVQTRRGIYQGGVFIPSAGRMYEDPTPPLSSGAERSGVEGPAVALRFLVDHKLSS